MGRSLVVADPGPGSANWCISSCLTLIFHVHVKKSSKVKLGINISAAEGVSRRFGIEKCKKQAIFRHQIGPQTNKYVREQL